MTDTTVADGDKPNSKGKTSQQILADMMAQTEASVAKEVRRSAKAWAEEALKNVEPDIRAMIVAKLAEKGDLDANGKFIVPSKKNPNRSAMEYVQKLAPSTFKTAETPNGDVELEAAKLACGSLKAKADLVRAVGVQRASELLALFGGSLDKITTPMPIKSDTPKPGAKKVTANPFADGDAARIIEYIGTHSTAEAQKLAQLAQTDLAGRPLRRRT